MFQLLLRAKVPASDEWSWSCVAVRPLASNSSILLEEELLEAVIESLDNATNPMAAVLAAGGEVGSLFVGASPVFIVYMETLTNLFVPITVLPMDDAFLVCDEMREQEGLTFKVIPVPASVFYPKLTYALASQTAMLKWWQN